MPTAASSLPVIATACSSLGLLRLKEAYSAIDLPRGLSRFVDVVSTRESSGDFRPALQFFLNRDLDLWRRSGEFRFTVLVAGDGIQPKLVKIRFVWTGTWDEFTVSRA